MKTEVKEIEDISSTKLPQLEETIEQYRLVEQRYIALNEETDYKINYEMREMKHEVSCGVETR
jgi:hypothetical protein